MILPDGVVVPVGEYSPRYHVDENNAHWTHYWVDGRDFVYDESGKLVTMHFVSDAPAFVSGGWAAIGTTSSSISRKLVASLGYVDLPHPYVLIGGAEHPIRYQWEVGDIWRKLGGVLRVQHVDGTAEEFEVVDTGYQRRVLEGVDAASVASWGQSLELEDFYIPDTFTGLVRYPDGSLRLIGASGMKVQRLPDGHVRFRDSANAFADSFHEFDAQGRRLTPIQGLWTAGGLVDEYELTEESIETTEFFIDPSEVGLPSWNFSSWKSVLFKPTGERFLWKPGDKFFYTNTNLVYVPAGGQQKVLINLHSGEKQTVGAQAVVSDDAPLKSLSGVATGGVLKDLNKPFVVEGGVEGAIDLVKDLGIVVQTQTDVGHPTSVVQPISIQKPPSTTDEAWQIALDIETLLKVAPDVYFDVSEGLLPKALLEVPRQDLIKGLRELILQDNGKAIWEAGVKAKDRYLQVEQLPDAVLRTLYWAVGGDAGLPKAPETLHQALWTRIDGGAFTFVDRPMSHGVLRLPKLDTHDTDFDMSVLRGELLEDESAWYYFPAAGEVIKETTATDGSGTEPASYGVELESGTNFWFYSLRDKDLPTAGGWFYHSKTPVKVPAGLVTAPDMEGHEAVADLLEVYAWSTPKYTPAYVASAVSGVLNGPGVPKTEAEATQMLLDHATELGLSQKAIFSAPWGVKKMMSSFVVLDDEEQLKSRGLSKWELVAGFNLYGDSGVWGFSSAPVLDPNSSYAKLLYAGLFSDKEVDNFWSHTAKSAFMEDFGKPGDSFQQTRNRFLVPDFDAIQKQKALETQLDKLTFTIVPGKGAKLSGGHKKVVALDQFGREWVAKPYKSATGQEQTYRVEAETFASKIVQLHGFRMPPVVMADLSGMLDEGFEQDTMKNFFIEWWEKKSNFDGVSAADIDPTLLVELAQEHVADWLISNHDSHGDNLMVGADGHVFSIDKGQAFKFFLNPDAPDELRYGYQPNASYGSYTFYDTIYAAIIDHTLSEEQANKLAERVIRRALVVERRRDPETRALFEQALANRPDNILYGQSVEEFVNALMDRKAHLGEDFEKFYRGILEQAGYEWKVPPLEALRAAKVEVEFHGTPHVIHAAASDDYIHDVQAARSFAVPIFHGGALDWQDTHTLSWTELAPDASTTLLGEGRLLKDSNDKIGAWVQARLDKMSDETGAATQVSSPQPVTHVELPHASSWFSNIENAAKTVNSHQADGEYNQTTLDALWQTEKAIQTAVQLIEKWKQEHSNALYQGALLGTEQKYYDGLTPFVDLAMQDEYLLMAARYTEYIGHIRQAYLNKTKTYLVEGAPTKEEGGFTAYPASYDVVATSGNAMPAFPEFSESWHVEEENVVIGQQVQGSATYWVKVNLQTGHREYVDEVYAQSLIGQTPADVIEEEEEEDLGLLFGMPVSLVKREAWRDGGDYDWDVGVLRQNGQRWEGSGPLNHENGAGDFGEQWDIEIGDKLIISYRPWDSSLGNKLTQRGLVRWRIKEFQGTVEELQQAYDALTQMGLDMSPADEESLELFYWLHLTRILEYRNKGNEESSLNLSLQNVLKQAKAEGWTGLELLNALKEVWGTYYTGDTSVDWWRRGVDEVDWMPHLRHSALVSTTDEANNTVPIDSGRPQWLRPEMSWEQIVTDWQTRQFLPELGHSTGYGASSGTDLATEGIVKAAILYPTEDRLRVFKRAAIKIGPSESSTGSPGEDQKKGSAEYIFVYQDGSGNVMVHPAVWLFTHTYNQSGDTYGSLTSKADVPFRFTSMLETAVHGGGELMAKYGVSFMDTISGMTSLSSEKRDYLIEWLHQRGVYQIRGVPVELRLSTSSRSNTLAALYDYLRDHPDAEI